MESVHQFYMPVEYTGKAKRSLVSQFMNWCASQEENRFLWLAIILAGHACFITPLTVTFVMFSGNSMLLWSLAIAAMAMTLITNLAAMPVKITIPVFFLSLAIDVTVITLSLIGLL